MGREMKGETVRGIWARMGWDPGKVSVGKWVGEGPDSNLLLLYMFATFVMWACHNARSMVEHSSRDLDKG